MGEQHQAGQQVVLASIRRSLRQTEPRPSSEGRSTTAAVVVAV